MKNQISMRTLSFFLAISTLPIVACAPIDDDADFDAETVDYQEEAVSSDNDLSTTPSDGRYAGQSCSDYPSCNQLTSDCESNGDHFSCGGYGANGGCVSGRCG